MRRDLRLALVGAFLVFVLAHTDRGNAYELRTHGEITRRAYEKSEGVTAYLQASGFEVTDTFDPTARTEPRRLGGFQNTATALDWMIEGAIREDDFSGGLLNRMLGCPDPQNPPSETNRVLHHFFDVQRGGRGLTILKELGLPAPDWALGRQGRGSGPGQNEYSLLDAREYQYQSLTAPSSDTRNQNVALLFKTLGQVLHNLQDMAQPQHTRNDPHADCSRVPDRVDGGHSWYEHYIEDRALRQIFRWSEQPPPPLVLEGYERVPIRPYDEFFADSAHRGMADFSSRNFLSVRTNLGSRSECGGLVAPPCQATAYQQWPQPFSTMTLKGPISGAVTLYTRAVVDQLTEQVIPNVPLSSRSVWDHFLENAERSPKFTLNRFNYDAMADLLLPRAVGYSAGFLDYFFRGRVSLGVEETGVRVLNSTPDQTMTGEFTLFSESEDGARFVLGRWPLALPPDVPSDARPVRRLPTDTPATTRCLLVFRGQLGVEAGAGAGSLVSCPLAPGAPPLPPAQPGAECARWHVVKFNNRVSPQVAMDLGYLILAYDDDPSNYLTPTEADQPYSLRRPGDVYCADGSRLPSDPSDG